MIIYPTIKFLFFYSALLVDAIHYRFFLMKPLCENDSDAVSLLELLPVTVSITLHSNRHLQHVLLQDFWTCGHTLNPVYVPVEQAHSTRVYYESASSKEFIIEFMAFYIQKLYSSRQKGDNI